MASKVYYKDNSFLITGIIKCGKELLVYRTRDRWLCIDN